MKKILIGTFISMLLIISAFSAAVVTDFRDPDSLLVADNSNSSTQTNSNKILNSTNVIESSPDITIPKDTNMQNENDNIMISNNPTRAARATVNDTFVDKIIPYNQASSPLTITATGDSDLDNITLWYRYSNDNVSWGREWWNHDWTYRKKLTITNNNNTDILLKGYTVNFTINTAGNKFLGNGDDLRIVWWNGTGYIELDRINNTAFNSDSTEILFRLQSNISSGSNDDSYYAYYGNSLAGTAPNNTSNVYFFEDLFNRVTSSTVGFGWIEQEASGADARIAPNVLVPTNVLDLYGVDRSMDCIALHSLDELSNRFIWEYGFVWDRDSAENHYEAYMQLGNSTMISTSPWTGVGLFLSWAKGTSTTIGIDTSSHEMMRVFDDDQTPTEIEVVSGGADIKLDVSLSEGNFKFYRDGTYKGTYNFYQSLSKYDTIRFVSDYMTPGNIQKRGIDYTRIKFIMDPTPSINLNGEERNYWNIWQDSSNPDSSYPWSWNFNFPNSTGYYEFFSIGNKSGSPDEVPPNNADAICFFNAFPNDPPIAYDDYYTTDEDTTLNLAAPGVLQNDTDPDNNTLSTLLITDVTNGILNLNTDGSFQYTPNSNYYGTDTFTYQAFDGIEYSNTATVTITINSVNDPPIANDDYYTTNEDTTLNIAIPGVLGNDTDVENDPLTATLVSDVTHGSLSLNSNGAFQYTPDTNYYGTDTFTYQANDGTDNSNTATVTITITPINDPPIANNDDYATNEDTTLIIATPGVLGNDTDVDGDTLTSFLITDVSNGVLNLNSNGRFQYTPNSNYYGTDTFTYHAYDGFEYSNTATVTITINSVNDPPIANDDYYTTNEDTTLNIAIPGVLGNDTDVENDPLTATLVSDVTHGSLSLNSNGAFQYTPDTNYYGTDTFTYQAYDNIAYSNTATVTITITPINDPPTANNDDYTTNEDTTLNIATPGVLTNDTDVDGDTLTTTLITDVTNGVLNLNSNGGFDYTPNSNYYGTDTFTYQAYDNIAYSNTASVTITINPVNDAPIANDDYYTTNEDTILSIATPGVLTNDTDVENDPLTATLISDVSYGTLSLNSNGGFQYTPDTNYYGTDTFTYQAYDGSANSNTATVTITINSVNDPPTANNDNYTTEEDTILNMPAPGVLSNDTDPENDPLTSILISDVGNGILTLNGDGSFIYTPNNGFVGTDSFTYKANDSLLESNIASVQIIVTQVNDPPVANDDNYSINEDTILNIAAPGILANDTDPENDALTASLITDVSNGVLNLNSNGGFDYTPDSNYYGTDLFTYRAYDGLEYSNIATVTITINPVNDPPVANNDEYSVNEDTTLNIATPGVLTNDTDVDGDTLTTTLITDVTNGVLNLNSNGGFDYTPNSNYYGTDTFTYQAYDNIAYSNTASVTITINPVNDAPIANDDYYTTNEDTILNIATPGVLTNDTDVENDPLTATLISDVSYGTLSLNSNGGFQYTPNSNYNGIDTFTYQANDGTDNSNTATVTITITPINDPPIANNDDYTTNEDTTLIIATPGVLGNDTDVDGDTLTAILISDVTHGALSLNSNGAFQYTPDTNYYGTDTFTYQAYDNIAYSNTATVTITITPINDPPTANNDDYTTNEDTTLNIATPGVLTNDTDVDGDTLTTTLITDVTNGVLNLNSNGGFDYTPNSNYYGTDTFTYQAYDNIAYSNTATVTITITPINDPPTANNDDYTTNEDTTLNIATPGVLTNDTDVENDPLTAALISDVSYGTLSLNSNGGFQYTPNSNYNGIDTFTYQANDGTDNSNTATVTITITPINDPPIANNDDYTTNEDTTLNIASPGVITNDTDVDGDTLTTTLIADVTNGVLNLNSNGGFDYTPNSNYYGTDTFTYQAYDDIAYSNTASVTITITSVNDAPIANDDYYTTNEDTILNIAVPGVLTNDTDVENDPLTAALISDVSYGTLSLNSNGGFQYTPNSNYNGIDTFTYQANDGTDNSNTATVTITINPVNDAPIANNDDYTTNEDTTLNIAPLGVITNDTDVDGDTLTAILISDVTHGALSLNSNGAFQYTPDTNYYGTDTFTYQANDGTDNSNTATVTITITPINDPPTAYNDDYTTNEDTTLNIATPGVLTNDTDVENDPLTATLVSDVTHGALSLNSNGAFQYTPDTNYYGTDTFTYQANDGTDNSNTATVTITVSGINDPPVANDDNYTTEEETTLNVPTPGILTNDTDPDNEPLTALLVSSVSEGILTFNTNGSYIYTPNSGYVGFDSFTYRAYDGTVVSNIAIVNINVTPVNDPPVAYDDYYSTNEDTILNIAEPGVLANDTDPENNNLSAILITNVSNGILNLNSNGSFIYNPSTNYYGTDSFTYRAYDGMEYSNTATVTITITPVNDPPTANDDYYTTEEDITLSVPAPGILTNDTDPENDPLTSIKLTDPSHGTITTFNADGSFIYSPDNGYVGLDSFTYKANDGAEDSNFATININVTYVNDPPIANDDNYTTDEDTTINIVASGVLQNDTDPDNNPLIAILISDVTNGILNLNSNGSFDYSPDTNYNGIDIFTYQAYDGLEYSNTATVTITINPVNDPPIANDDDYTTNEDTTLNIAVPGVLGNDTDIENDPLTATLITDVTHGVLTFYSNGSFIFTPDTDYVGTDTFTYQANDGTDNSNTATVTITITPENDPPTANNDDYTTNEDTTLNIATPGVLTNDTDVENDPLTAALISDVSYGTLSLNSNGGFQYTPNSNYNGIDTFTYQANDGLEYSNTATVTITINPINDPPVAYDDTYTIDEDTTLAVSAPGILGNDTDPENDPLTAVLVDGVSQGSLTFYSNGSFIYTPNTNYEGSDSFTYRAYDGLVVSNIATVYLTITPVNDPPIANDDDYTTNEDTTLNVGVPGVLSNDTDIENDPLTAILITDVAHGTLNLNTFGGFQYIPDLNYNGIDTFTYQANDGTDNSNTATVTITITPVNDPPTANDDSYTTDEDTTLTVPAPGILTNDTDVENDPLTATLISDVTHGELTFNENGSFIYVPDAGFVGSDSYTYRAYDGALVSNLATVYLTITPVNDPPVAYDDYYTTDEDTTLIVPAPGILTNDTDIENDPLTAILVSDVTNGLLNLNSNGSFDYSPDTNYNGIDIFTYQAYDGLEYSDTATVTITINPVNDPPIANNDYNITDEDTILIIPAPGILTNDTDPENDPLIAILITDVSHGTLTLNENGSINYTPDNEYIGSDSFTYKANDSSDDSNTATVFLTITPLNDPPVANDDNYTTNEDITLNVAAAGVLENDTDPENDPLIAILVSDVSNGILNLNFNGAFDYNPSTNYYGTDSFTYRAYDGMEYSNTATVTITITPVNDPPTANDDYYTTEEDITLSVPAPGILTNDTDPENDPLTSIKLTDPSHGTITTFNADGSFIYSPDNGYVGLDSFTYKANDGAEDSNFATININVTYVNDPPIANDDNYTTDEDTTINIVASGVLQNDTDPDNNPLIAILISDVTNGILNLNSNGSFDYSPDTNYNGIDIFTYQAYDGLEYSNTATVTITINPVNDPPIANDDDYTTNEDTTLNIAVPGVLGNDTDIENDPLTATLITDVTHGVLTFYSNGSFIFTPDTDYVGTDTFTYQANDGTDNSNTATVTITITPENDPPTANNDDYTTNEDTTLNIATPGVLTNDTDVENDPLTAALISDVSYGTLSLNSNGGFQYTPNSNYNGIDTFTYQANDGLEYSNTATVTITINPINDPPVAYDDTYTIDEDTTLAVSAPGILGNDTDPENDPLTAVLVDGVSQGSLTFYSNGSFIYTPNTNYEGSDSFTYRAYDGLVVSNIATVYLTITPVNDPPIANDDDYTTNEDTTLNVGVPGVLSNDTDIENDPLTAILITDVAHGTLNLNTFGGFQYIPDLNYNGIDTFTYQANDGTDNSNTATVTITITPVNDPPTANDDSYTTDEDTTLTVPAPGILTNDTDVENDPLTATLISDVTHGELTFNENGSFIYVPDAGFVGSDSYTYRAYDGALVSNLATVYLTITPVNDPPVAYDDYYTTDEDTTLIVPAPGILTNDTDIENDPLTAILVSDVTNGLLNLNSNGSFDYSPDTNYNGIDIFTYQAYDGLEYSNTATVTITINPINDPPIANDDSVLVNEDSIDNQIDVLLNDNDVDGDNLDIISVSLPSHGNITFTLDYVFYTPDLNYNGPDEFDYTITDNNGETDTAIVNVTVTPQNDPPYSPSNPIPSDGQLDIEINANLSWAGGDLDGDPVTYDVYFGLTSPPQQVVSNQSDTSYLPGTMNFSTDYYWKIIAWDNQGASASGPIWNFTTEGEYDWECILTFEEPGGGYDNSYFGEKLTASDNQDSWDIPKDPAGSPPYIRAWFDTDLTDPYDELWKEYKHSPDENKQWNLTVKWAPSDNSSPSNITISWNSSLLNGSEYNNIFLKNNLSEETINMFVDNNYTFNALASTSYDFMIICSNTMDITELNTNWNIISIPFNQSIGKTEIIVRYNGSEYSWQDAVNNNIILGFIYSWTRNAPQHYELINTLKPGYGYWVYAYQPCTLLVDGASSKNNDGYITSMLTTWNIIGLPNFVSLPKEDLFVRYNGVYYDWNNATTGNNPTGGPIILGFIYNWTRSLPQHYELSNIIDPGYGYQMYAYYNCSLYYSVFGPLGRMPIGQMNDLQVLSSSEEKDSIIQNNEVEVAWDIKLEFNEPDGAYGNAFFGEKIKAENDQDIYDVPKNPSGISPYLNVWFETSFSGPYNKLWEEYKQYPNNYNEWNLIIQWVPSDSVSLTLVTISWDENSFDNCNYNSITLYNENNNIKVIDMLNNEKYTFTCKALTLHKFKIICSTNKLPITPNNPKPYDSEIIEDSDVSLSWSGGDSDSDDIVNYQVYFGKTTQPSNVISNQLETTFELGKLDKNTVYYWRIISTDNNGATATSPIWSFTIKDSEDDLEGITNNVTLENRYPDQKILREH